MVKKLGRGLDALIRKTAPVPVTSEPDPVAEDYQIRHLDPAVIAVNRDQPRAHFDEESIAELAQSIEHEGVLQPLVVHPLKDGSYELIAGERRLRACRKLGLETVPVVVRIVPSDSLLELALVENIQREDLNPIELALAYRALRKRNDWTQAELADQLGKKRSSVANILRLLELPDIVQAALAAKTLTAGHAKVLLTVADPGQLATFFEGTIADRLSVRQLEQWVRGEPAEEDRSDPIASSGRAGTGGKTRRDLAGDGAPKPAHLVDQENILAAALGTKVDIRESSNGGRIIVEFYSGDDFERIKQQILLGRDRSTQ